MVFRAAAPGIVSVWQLLTRGVRFISASRHWQPAQIRTKGDAEFFGKLVERLPSFCIQVDALSLLLPSDCGRAFARNENSVVALGGLACLKSVVPSAVATLVFRALEESGNPDSDQCVANIGAEFARYIHAVYALPESRARKNPGNEIDRPPSQYQGCLRWD
jgi:hypothetical protein